MKIKVIVVAPELTPAVTEVDNDLTALQGAVGGYIQQAFPAGFAEVRLSLVCNEDGDALRLRPNRIVPALGIVRGTFLIVAYEGEEFVSLTVEQERYALQQARSWTFFRAEGRPDIDAGGLGLPS